MTESNQKSFIIRPEVDTDHAAVSRLLDQAFGQPDEGVLVGRLRDHEAYIPSLSLVAEINSKIIGHILFSKIIIEDGPRQHPSLALAPLAVLPDYQKTGVGSALVKNGLDIACQEGFTSVIVLGHPEYYPRFGFKPASQWQISTTFEVSDENYMALPLQPDALKHVSGSVRYADPFYQ